MTEQMDEANLETDSTAKSSTRESENATTTPSAPVRADVEIDDAGIAVCYANFCRVTGTPEELILDFGLNAQPFGVPARVEVRQRLVVNYFTAKRLLQALGLSVQRHEAAFGTLETDIQKRVTPLARRSVPG